MVELPRDVVESLRDMVELPRDVVELPRNVVELPRNDQVTSERISPWTCHLIHLCPDAGDDQVMFDGAEPGRSRRGVT